MYYTLFREKSIDCPNRSTGRTKVVCPTCDGGSKREKSLSLDYDNGFYKCHRASCGWQGKVGYQKKYKKPIFSNKTELPKDVVQWFEGRGISQKTLNRMKITFDKGNINFNYFRNDELINIKYRNLKEKKFYQHKEAEKIFYNIDSIKGKSKVIIVEGEMDVLSWMEVIPNDFGVISLDQGAGALNSSLNGKLECLKNCAESINELKEIYLCLDRDEAGIYTQNNLIKRLGEHRCFTIPLPDGVKDANDVMQNKMYDIAIRKESLKRCLQSATPIPVLGIHEINDPLAAKMLNQFRHGRAKGVTTHFPYFDRCFTILAGEMTLFTGTPGSGKSQFLRQIMVNKSYFDGWKWACFVPEDAPSDYFYDDLIEITLGMSVDKDKDNCCTEDQYINTLEFISNHFYFIYPERDENGSFSMPDNKWINDKIRFLTLKYGVNAYVKDPWNKIYHNFREREDTYLTKELSKEKFFAADYDAAFYVTHPVGAKVKKDKEGNYKPVDLYSISGGSMWFNGIDNGIIVNRPYMMTNDLDRSVNIYTKKIKKKKQVGRIGQTEFEYSTKNNRYYVLDDFDIKYNPFDDDKKKSTGTDNVEEFTVNNNDDIPF